MEKPITEVSKVKPGSFEETLGKILDGVPEEFKPSAEETKDYEKIVKDANLMFLARFGNFIPEETKKRVQGIEKRLIIAPNQEAYARYLQIIDGTLKDTPLEEIIKRTRRKLGLSTTSIKKSTGEPVDVFIMFNFDACEFENFSVSENAITDLQKSWKTDDINVIKEKWFLVFSTTAIFHKLSHAFQNIKLSHEESETNRTFFEAGAQYYSLLLGVQLLKNEHVSQEKQGQAFEFYSGLIDKFGDDVHRLFFGQLVEESIQQTILNEITSAKIAQLKFGEETDFTVN